jgi:hypothetical protein
MKKNWIKICDMAIKNAHKNLKGIKGNPYIGTKEKEGRVEECASHLFNVLTNKYILQVLQG